MPHKRTEFLKRSGHLLMRPGASWLSSLLGLLLLIPFLLLSATLFIILLAAGLLGVLWLWWKTRSLRRQMAAQQPPCDESRERAAAPANPATGTIIEGEARRIDEPTLPER